MALPLVEACKDREKAFCVGTERMRIHWAGFKKIGGWILNIMPLPSARAEAEERGQGMA